MSAMDVAVKWREALGATIKTFRGSVSVLCVCVLVCIFFKCWISERSYPTGYAIHASIAGARLDWKLHCASFCHPCVIMLLCERGVFQSVVLLNACMSACVAWPASLTLKVSCNGS